MGPKCHEKHINLDSYLIAKLIQYKIGIIKTIKIISMTNYHIIVFNTLTSAEHDPAIKGSDSLKSDAINSDKSPLS